MLQHASSVDQLVEANGKSMATQTSDAAKALCADGRGQCTSGTVIDTNSFSSSQMLNANGESSTVPTSDAAASPNTDYHAAPHARYLDGEPTSFIY